MVARTAQWWHVDKGEAFDLFVSVFWLGLILDWLGLV